MNAGVDVSAVSAPALVTSPVASRDVSAAPVVSPPAAPMVKFEVSTERVRTSPKNVNDFVVQAVVTRLFVTDRAIVATPAVPSAQIMRFETASAANVTARPLVAANVGVAPHWPAVGVFAVYINR